MMAWWIDITTSAIRLSLVLTWLFHASIHQQKGCKNQVSCGKRAWEPRLRCVIRMNSLTIEQGMTRWSYWYQIKYELTFNSLSHAGETVFFILLNTSHSQVQAVIIIYNYNCYNYCIQLHSSRIYKVSYRWKIHLCEYKKYRFKQLIVIIIVIESILVMR